jgi:hypothetical protein
VDPVAAVVQVVAVDPAAVAAAVVQVVAAVQVVLQDTMELAVVAAIVG